MSNMIIHVYTLKNLKSLDKTTFLLYNLFTEYFQTTKILFGGKNEKNSKKSDVIYFNINLLF